MILDNALLRLEWLGRGVYQVLTVTSYKLGNSDAVAHLPHEVHDRRNLVL